jgi:hypothetical protein
MRKVLFYGLLILSPCLFSFSQTSSDVPLADELVGIYTGMFSKDGKLNKEYKVKVTKISDNVIQVVPFDGGGSTPFKAKVWEDNLSAIRVIRLEPLTEIVLKNGMVTPANGRMSYGISSGSGLPMEVFSGIKP